MPAGNSSHKRTSLRFGFRPEPDPRPFPGPRPLPAPRPGTLFLLSIPPSLQRPRQPGIPYIRSMNMITDIRKVINYWWIFIVLGALLIIFGLIVMNHPVATFAELTIFFSIAFIVNGLLEIAFAISNYRSVHGWGWHLAGGILDLVLGLILILTPVLAA